MATKGTLIPVTEIKRDMTVKLLPQGKRRRLTVEVESIQRDPARKDTTRVWGVTPNGYLARRGMWRVSNDQMVEIVEEG